MQNFETEISVLEDHYRTEKKPYSKENDCARVLDLITFKIILKLISVFHKSSHWLIVSATRFIKNNHIKGRHIAHF